MKIDSNIVKEIHAIEIKGDTTIQQMYDDFYEIMKNHKIFQWKKSKEGNGHSGNSPEFVMCHAVFKQHVENKITLMTIMGGTDMFNFKVPDSVWEGKENN